MKVAIFGTSNINEIELEGHLPENVTEIVCDGGNNTVDSQARSYATAHNIKYLRILPEYDICGNSAPKMNYDEIINEVDMILAFWDGKSDDVKYVIENCHFLSQKVKIIMYK